MHKKKIYFSKNPLVLRLICKSVGQCNVHYYERAGKEMFDNDDHNSNDSNINDSNKSM